MNVVVLRGHLSRAPEHRELATGSLVVGYELTVERDDGPAETVPVVWSDPPARAVVDHEPGAELVVLGRVRRRFFKAGGATQSRTEVVAEELVGARQAKRVSALLARAAERL